MECERVALVKQLRVFFQHPAHAVPALKAMVEHPDLGIHPLLFQPVVEDGDELRFGIRIPAAGGHQTGLIGFRLILRGERTDMHAVLLVSLEELDDILDIALDELIAHIAARDAAAGLHPAGRAPRRGKQLDLRIDSQHFLDHRQDIFLIALDGEMLKADVALHVVIGIDVSGIVAGTHGNTAHIQTKAILAVNRLQELAARLRAHRAQLVAGGIRDRDAHAVILVALGRFVDPDRAGVGHIIAHRTEHMREAVLPLHRGRIQLIMLSRHILRNLHEKSIPFLFFHAAADDALGKVFLEERVEA